MTDTRAVQAPRVGVDATQLEANGLGVSRFLELFLRTVAEVGADPSPDLGFHVFLREDANLPDLPRAPHLTYEPVSVPKTVLWELWGFDRALDETGADVALTLSDRARTSTPLVVYLFEVPDRRARLHRDTASLYQRLADRLTQAVFGRTMKAADKIVTSSEATRRDLYRFHNVETSAVDVVPAAPGPQFEPPTKDDDLDTVRVNYGASDGYILHFSSHNDPRDNTPTALRAYADYLDRGGNVDTLLVAGVDEFQAFGLPALVDELGLADHLEFAGFLRGQELVATYQGADVYLDPSWYEGFGFQVAEAMACGVPVVCSDRTSLPEVAGHAALLVPPDEPSTIAECLHETTEDSELARELSKRAIDRSSEFTWERTTRGVISAIQEVALPSP